MKSLLILTLTVLVSACAAPQNEQTAANESDVVCAREVRLGSMFTNQRCRTAAQREDDKREAGRVGDMIRPAAVTPVNGGS